MKNNSLYQFIFKNPLGLKKSSSVYYAYKTIFIFLIFTLFAPLIANDKPLLCSYKNTLLFPAFSFKNEITIDNEIINYNMRKDWKLLNSDFILFTFCSYSPNTIDADNAPRVGPFDRQIITLKNNQVISLPLKNWHWLGTTQNGNDVLAGIIYGSRITFLVGFISMLIASFIGIPLGAIAGYYSNNSFKISFLQFSFILLGLFFGWFYGYIVNAGTLANGLKTGGIELLLSVTQSLFVFFITLFFCMWLGNKLSGMLKLIPQIHIPLDGIITKIMETISVIPSLLLIITLSAIAKPSYTLLILITGFLSWIPIARLTRAEFMKAKQFDYVTACNAFGMSSLKIMIKQILPNVFPIILIQIVFGITSTVFVESSLSFLGVGVPSNTITWGFLLNEARNYYCAWWLIAFPGLCLLILTLSLNSIANFLSEKK